MKNRARSHEGRGGGAWKWQREHETRCQLMRSTDSTEREKRGAQRKEKGFKYKLYIESRINHLFRWFCDVCNKAIYGARGVYCTVNNKI